MREGRGRLSFLQSFWEIKINSNCTSYRKTDYKYLIFNTSDSSAGKPAQIPIKGRVCVCKTKENHKYTDSFFFFHCCSCCVISKSVLFRISSRWQDNHTYLTFIPFLPLYFYYLRVAVICTAFVVLSVPRALGSPLVISSAVLQQKSAQSLTKFSCWSLS